MPTDPTATAATRRSYFDTVRSMTTDPEILAAVDKAEASSKRDVQPEHEPTTTAVPRALAVWREHDHRYRRFGFSIWLTGAEFSIGRRFYRMRWAFRG